jgi:large subunit ribosomal protein L24
MKKLRKDDQVIVITGRDKGKKGVVVSRIDDEYLLVDGVNQVKKHTKPNPMKGIGGGIVEKSMPVHQSNLAIFNPLTSKADRVGVMIDAAGKKIRVFRSSGAHIGM